MVWHQTCYIMLHGFTNSKCVQHKVDMIPFGSSHVVSCLFINTFHVARANSFTLFTAHKDLTVGLSAKFQYHWTTANNAMNDRGCDQDDLIYACTAHSKIHAF